jgi:hypothetical protein
MAQILPLLEQESALATKVLALLRQPPKRGKNEMKRAQRQLSEKLSGVLSRVLLVPLNSRKS